MMASRTSKPAHNHNLLQYITMTIAEVLILGLPHQFQNVYSGSIEMGGGTTTFILVETLKETISAQWHTIWLKLKLMPYVILSWKTSTLACTFLTSKHFKVQFLCILRSNSYVAPEKIMQYCFRWLMLESLRI
jgi:hypothetical protein